MKLKKTIAYFQSLGEAVDIQNAFFELGNSFHQGGDVHDTDNIPGYVRADHNGHLAYGPERLAEQFPEYEVMTLKDLKKLSEKDVSISDKCAEVSAVVPVISDGLSTSYYQLTITNKAGESINCEMGDVIRCTVGDNFSLGNVLKAVRRIYQNSLGKGKMGVSMEYDINKCKYFLDTFRQHYEV